MPRAKISKAVIDSVPYTDAGQLIVWDTELRGFGLLVNQASKSFIVQRDLNRRTTRINIGRYGLYTADQARKEAMRLMLLMSQGLDPRLEQKILKAKSLTLNDLAEEFLKIRPLKERTRNDYRYNLQRYLADWLDKPVTDISEEKFMERYFHIGENNGKTVANNVRRILGAMLNYGIAAHKIFDKNPVRIIAETKSAYPQKRRRSYIKPHQFPDLWKAIHEEENDVCRDFLLLVLFTGLRKSEACALRWENVDLKDKTLTIPETKNNETLVLPMSDFIYDMLSWRHKEYGHSEWVFPGEGKSGHLQEPKKALHRITKKTGIKFSLHDLRRTYISVAESLDISMFALKRLLNHKITGDVTGGYVIVNAERLRDPVRRVAEAILTYAKAVPVNKTT